MKQMKNLEHFIKVAKGEEKAQLVLKNAKVFYSFTGEFIKSDIAVENGYIAGTGSNYKGEKEIDFSGYFITPGFIDGHIHIESSMLSPLEFAKAVVPLGTTTVIADPHEIANVTGMAGIRYMLDATENIPLDAYFMLPSCVPATKLENSGGELLAEDLAELIDHPRVLGLGEMMNYPGVLAGNKEVLAKLSIAEKKRVDGHAPGLSGKNLMAYAAAGIDSDHECISKDQALERLRAGMYVMLREGSAAKNLQALLSVINPATAQFCCFAADDRHPTDLLKEGHINHMIKMAVEGGTSVATALQMATINTARYFGLADAGAIAPGYKADLLAFKDHSWRPSMVFKDGVLVAENGKVMIKGESRVPKEIEQTMHIAPIDLAKLKISMQQGNIAQVIGLIPYQIVTKNLKMKVKVKNGEAVADAEQDILKLVVIERHHETGNIGTGLVHGFGLKKGAIASTIAHDSHNLIIIGENDKDIFRAAEELERIGGGITIVADGKVIGALSLPIAGLMSKESVTVVEKKLSLLKKEAYDLGVYEHYDPFLTLAFLSLPVIPALKLTDMGLVDVEKFTIVPVTEKV